MPSGRVWYPVAPDIIINGNSVTLTYTARHVSYPDDLGIPWLLAVWMFIVGFTTDERLWHSAN
ncbi:hypothetical protein ACLB1E_14150 [Escherichia coli]